MESAASRARTANLENVSKPVAERMFSEMKEYGAVVFQIDEGKGSKRIPPPRWRKRKHADDEVPPTPQIKAVFNTAEQLCNYAGTEMVVRMWFDGDTGMFRFAVCFLFALLFVWR